jgi:hypothetical protein
MLPTTRRRALALLLATAAGLYAFPPFRLALSAEPDGPADDAGDAGDTNATESGDADQESSGETGEGTGEGEDTGESEDIAPSDEQEECYDSQKFGIWLGQATDKKAAARTNDVAFTDPDKSPLRADVRVTASLDAQLVLYADTDKLTLSKDYLVKPDNRLIVKDEHGKEQVNEVLCGNCTEIEEDKFEVVMPLSTAPLLRDGSAIEIVFKLQGQDDCGFKLELADMHEALDWAKERQAALADKAKEGSCVPFVEE